MGVGAARERHSHLRVGGWVGGWVGDKGVGGWVGGWVGMWVGSLTCRLRLSPRPGGCG